MEIIEILMRDLHALTTPRMRRGAICMTKGGGGGKEGRVTRLMTFAHLACQSYEEED